MSIANKMLKETIQEDLKTALKKKDEVTLLVLRSLFAEINNKEIELKKKEEGLDDGEIGQEVLKEIKKRKDAIEQYKKGGRDDLVDSEAREMEVLQKYAPQQLSKEEITKVVDDIIKDVGASDMQDVGQVMGAVMKKLENKADGKLVSAIVKEKLQ